MKKNILLYLVAALPLITVNALCLSVGYLEADNLQINVMVLSLFAVVSLLIAVTKLFFDFFAAVITARCTHTEASKSAITDVLIRSMLPQWIATLLGLLVSHVLFPEAAAPLSLVNFAVAHSVYYGCTGFGMKKRFGKPVFCVIYGAIAAVCWIYVACSISSVI